MSVDRFIAIAFPIFYHKYMQQSCVLSFNWLIWALGVGLGAVYPAMSIQKTPNLWLCTSSTILLDWAQTANVELANVLMSNTVCFALFNAFLTLPIYLATVEQLRNDFFRILKIKEVTTVQPLRSQTQSVAKPKTSP